MYWSTISSFNACIGSTIRKHIILHKTKPPLGLNPNGSFIFVCVIFRSGQQNGIAFDFYFKNKIQF